MNKKQQIHTFMSRKKIKLVLRKSKGKPGYGAIYCAYFPKSEKESWFPLGIVITEKEWQNYVSINYYYQTRMPTLGILYYKFADFLDRVTETAEGSDWKDAKMNVQRLMMRMCTINL